ncbi:MAG: CotH kinase family protein, partial [Saprospiraceae bacterium]
FSIAGDSLQDLANGTREIRPVGSIESFGTDGLRKASSYGELNAHGQDSWVNDQRSLDWISRDEMGYSKAIKQKLFDYSDRDEYQRVIFRAAGDDNYPATPAPEHIGSCHLRDDYAQTLAKLGGLQLDERTSDRCIVFLNGEYWGVYSIREIPDDHDYTDYYYQQGKYDIQFLETWGDTWSAYGGDRAKNEWNELRRFILGNDMSDPANYQKAKDSIDLLSMIDYFLVNLNVVTSDWLNYNTGWWRGLDEIGGHKKWGYILWDLDATFNYYINYSGVPNTNYNAEPCDLESISNYVQNDFFSGAKEDTCIQYIQQPDTFTYCFKIDGKHQLILLKLLAENPEFRELYYGRQADLINSVFSCDNMLTVFDSMVAVIAPEMPRHIARWGGSLSKWHANVQKMRTYIANRCGYFDNAMLNCYDELNGPYPVTLLVDPPGAGTIELNTLEHNQFPWTGDYYGGMNNHLLAKTASAIPFHHWESRSGTLINPDLTSPSATFDLAAPDTLVAVFSFLSSTHDAPGNITLNVYPTLVHDNIVNVSYTLPKSLPIQIKLYSFIGQPVATWNETSLAKHELQLNLSENQLPPGMYQLELTAGPYRKSVKLILD